MSFLSAQMFIFAAPVIAVNVLAASDSEVGLLNAASGLGTLVFLLALGWIADFRRKDIVLGMISVFRGAVMALLSYACYTGGLELWHIILASFIIAGVTAVYDSSFSAAVPSLLDDVILPRANTWIASLRSVADIGAGSIAGVILARWGEAPCLIVLAAMYFMASLAPFGMRNHMNYQDSKGGDGLVVEYKGVWSGFKYLGIDRMQRAITASIAHFNLFTAAIQALYVVYAIRYVGMSAFELGLAVGLGGLIAAASISISNRIISAYRPVTVLWLTFFVPGLAGPGMLLLQDIPHALGVIVMGLILAIWAFCMLTNMSICETIKQVYVPRSVIGRFSSASRIITWGADPIGAGIAAFAVAFISIHYVMVACFAGILVSAIWVLLSPEVRSIKVGVVS